MFITSAFILSVCSAVHAQEIQSLFSEGNRLYQDGRYDEALIKYQEIIKNGFESGELYYNIGNAHYKSNRMGKAVLYFERSQRLMPENEDLLHNIELTSLSLADKITPISEVFYARYWNNFRRLLSLPGWKIIFFATWFLAAAISIMLLFITQYQARKILKTGLVLWGAVIIIVSSVFISSIIMDKPGMDAVIMEREITAYSSPSESGTQVFLIHEGTKIRITRTLGEWFEIRLADGNVGWIQKNTFEVI